MRERELFYQLRAAIDATYNITLLRVLKEAKNEGLLTQPCVVQVFKLLLNGGVSESVLKQVVPIMGLCETLQSPPSGYLILLFLRDTRRYSIFENVLKPVCGLSFDDPRYASDLEKLLKASKEIQMHDAVAFLEAFKNER